jgi:lysozyme family protein
MIILGDSIAVGLGQQFPQAEVDAVVGASAAAIYRAAGDHFDFSIPIIISAGSNDLRSSPELEATLRQIRSVLPADESPIWILPANDARASVEKVAAEYGDTTVAFAPGRDGIHPRSYVALAEDVRAVLSPTVTSMRDGFPRALQLVLVHEGGYVDHPKDPGGATNKGITIATFRSFTKNPNATKAELRNISDETVAAIYRRNYWNQIRGDQLPAGIDYALFDFAVNSGPTRAVKMLQRVVEASVDGKVGPETISKVIAYGVGRAIKDLCTSRLSWLQTLGTWGTFGLGWTRRVNAVQRDALAMLGTAPQPLPQSPPNRPPEDPEDAVRGDDAQRGLFGWLLALLKAIFGGKR